MKSIKKLTFADYRSMPWKNGAGTTVEIAVFPEHASMDDFVWRVSRAQVNTDGGFSQFAGIDRSLALLKGEGMHLTVDGAVHTVDETTNIASFRGDAKTHAELIGGEIRDFNLMSRRAVCSHELHRWTGESAQQLPKGAVLVYCAKGSGTFSADGLETDLGEDESILLGSTTELLEGQSQILKIHTSSVFYCAQITMKANNEFVG